MLPSCAARMRVAQRCTGRQPRASRTSRRRCWRNPRRDRRRRCLRMPRRMVPSPREMGLQCHRSQWSALQLRRAQRRRLGCCTWTRRLRLRRHRWWNCRTGRAAVRCISRLGARTLACLRCFSQARRKLIASCVNSCSRCHQVPAMRNLWDNALSSILGVCSGGNPSHEARSFLCSGL